MEITFNLNVDSLQIINYVDVDAMETELLNDYLNNLCVYIYRVYGVTMYDSLNDRNETELILKYVNNGSIKLSYNLDLDAVRVLDAMEKDE